MACKCRKIEIGKDTAKSIRGYVFCNECIDKGQAGYLGLKLLMAEAIRFEMEEIKKQSQGAEFTVIPSKEEIN